MSSNEFERSAQLARSGDVLAIYSSLQSARSQMDTALSSIRPALDKSPPRTTSDLPDSALRLSNGYEPYFQLALALAYFQQPRLDRVQECLLDILHPKSWDHTGLTIIGSLPESYGYFFATLYGAYLSSNGDYNLLLEFVRAPLPSGSTLRPILDRPELVGWPEALGGNSLIAIRTLLQLIEKWDWIQSAFPSADDLSASICGYSFALNLAEFVRTGPSKEIWDAELGGLMFSTPIHWTRFPAATQRLAFAKIYAHRAALASALGPPSTGFQSTVAERWKYWDRQIAFWNRRERGFDVAVNTLELGNSVLNLAAK